MTDKPREGRNSPQHDRDRKKATVPPEQPSQTGLPSKISNKKWPIRPFSLRTTKLASENTGYSDQIAAKSPIPAK